MIKEEIVKKVSDTLVEAGCSFCEEKKQVYRAAIEKENNENAKWVLETLVENAEVAEVNRGPLCDDTGIPHLLLEIGPGGNISAEMLESIKEGVRQGLKKLPGRPMAIKGEERQRIDQSGGLDEDPAAVEAAPILLRQSDKPGVRLHILLFGGGPAIRGKTYRVFHKHDTENVIKEIVEWSKEGVAQLGCTPCTLAVGIGRSHYEATALMVQAAADGDYSRQSELEQKITQRVNEANIGALGLGGNTSVLGTFIKVGPQRASGVRIVCVRPCCCVEPRKACIEL